MRYAKLISEMTLLIGVKAEVTVSEAEVCGSLCRYTHVTWSADEWTGPSLAHILGLCQYEQEANNTFWSVSITACTWHVDVKAINLRVSFVYDIQRSRLPDPL